MVTKEEKKLLDTMYVVAESSKKSSNTCNKSEDFDEYHQNYINSISVEQLQAESYMDDGIVHDNIYNFPCFCMPLTDDCGKYDTLGERWFFESKFWKLWLLLGYTPYSTIACKSYLSYANISRICNKIPWKHDIDILSALHITFTERNSQSGWTHNILISSKKTNLMHINELYDYWAHKNAEILNLKGYISIGNHFVMRGGFYHKIYENDE